MRLLIGVAGLAMMLLLPGLLPAAATTSAPADKRLPVPPATSQAIADKLLREIYRPYPPALAEERRALALTLIEQSRGTVDDPSARFVLLREARDLAIGVGDVPVAVRAVDEMAIVFKVDGDDQKLLAIQRARPNVTTVAGARSAAEVAIRLARRAIESGDNQLATGAINMAENYSVSTRNNEIIVAVRKQIDELRKRQAFLSQVRTAETRLQSFPNDPEANNIAGQYYCLSQREWDKGIPMLAKGSDADLKAAAIAELNQPRDADSQLALANQWWNLSDRYPASARVIKRHAVVWYKLALPELTGLRKTLAMQRINEIEPPPPPPIIAPTPAPTPTPRPKPPASRPIDHRPTIVPK
jgi:hypothetical protein